MASFESVAVQSLRGRLADLARRPSLHLRVLLSHLRLDAALASGVDPDSDPALALRATQLLGGRYRRRLAASIEHLVEELEADRAYRLSAAVPVVRDQAAEARGTLLSLAEVLRAVKTVQPRGVAMADALMRDPASPLYLRTARGALQLRAGSALDCLLGERWARVETPPVSAESSDGGARGDR